MNEIESIKTIVLALTFIVAGIQDWKYREIPPKIWLPSMAIGILSNAYLFVSMNLNDSLYLILITITSIMLIIFAILTFWLKLFGGADFLALLTFSLNYPFSTMLNSLYLYIRPDVNLLYLLIAILPPIVIILLFYCFLVFLIIIYNII